MTAVTGREGADAHLLALAGAAFAPACPSIIGVAVSGGGDSMALLHLLARVQAGRGGTVRAVTVDHGLRPESADEARFVAGICARIGVAHDTRVWDHGDLAGNLPDRARRARYALIAAWAREGGIGHVALGHTADDRAETFLMELAREAGIDGLSAMRADWNAGGVHWARPLLTAGRAELRAFLRRHGAGWIEDPTNDDAAYQRVRARRALQALAPLGITAAGLAHVAENLARARAELVRHAARAAETMVTESAGELLIDRDDWLNAGPETARRLLVGALRWVASAEYAPRAAQVARLDAALRAGRDATLAGCRLYVGRAHIAIAREAKAVVGLETPTEALWDGRWRLLGPHDPALRVRMLGAGGLGGCPDWRATGHSRAALIVSPAVWRGETLVAAPLAGRPNGWTAEIVAGFLSFLLSH